jgi:predicted nucleic acid-binding protein
VSRPVLLDTSFLVALERETASGEHGPARKFLPSLRGRRIVVSIVSVEEILEGAVDEAAAFAALQRFAIQGLHLAPARRCALLQRRATRRMGEMMRGSSLPQIRSTRMSSEPIARRSSGWGHVISAAVNAQRP